ncbi:MAG: T9SS C-terminal target domain-containing protein [Ignavibacteriae bacterium]|nr:MAG: T9SS C-terminal target domain-containing protein [Ignavibacteriota bacterium]
MYKHLYILIFFNSCLLFSQQGWFWQSPLPQGNDINDIYWLNSNTAYLAGACGTIMKTTDKGRNWVIQYNGIKYSLGVIRFFNENSGIAAGSNGTILRTTNAGNNWIVVDSGKYKWYHAIDFINQSTGWLQSFHESINVLYKTTNSGANWNADSIYLNFNTSGSDCMKWLSADTCLISTSNNIGNYLYKTVNGGINWQVKLTLPYQSYIAHLVFINSYTGWVRGGNSVYKTTNRGENWTAIFTPVNVSFYDLSFSNINNGLVTGSMNNNSLIYKTTNGGENWSLAFSINKSNYSYITDIALNTNDVIAAGSQGLIYISSNTGTSWDSICYNVADEYRKPVFLNDNTGFILSGRFQGPGFASSTSDGGFTWYSKIIDTTTNFDALYFINENTGWAGNLNCIYKTTNRGINWAKIYSNDTSYYFNCITFPSYNTGYISGGFGILKTVNAGENWQKIFNVGMDVQAMYFINEITGWVVTYFRNIYKTTNGGNTWNYNMSIAAPQENSYKIIFSDENTGFVISDHGINRSTNGGANWTWIYPYSNPITDLTITPSKKVWAIDLQGRVISSYDLGNSWIEYFIFFNTYYSNSIAFTSENTGYIFSANSKILKTTTASIGIKPISNNVPSGYHLYQNYPNPFNPSTNINFDIGGNEKVKAKIILYDMLGRQAAIMLDEELSPGEYNIKWNGANLASGIYFCQLTISNGQLTKVFTETKKMVLLK